VLGEVVAVHDYGGGPSLEVKREAGAPVMVPFTNRVVPVVDVPAGKVVIDPPEGLLETPAPEPRSAEDE
jgi:16S rRNA processing protein RimM